MVGKSQAPMFRGEKPAETKLAPEWTLERVARHAVDFWLSTKDLPSPDNRAVIDRQGFGVDLASSVLDTHCKAHELDNLYVVDTSFYPSIGAVNPALTAMANALRVGDHLLE